MTNRWHNWKIWHWLWLVLLFGLDLCCGSRIIESMTCAGEIATIVIDVHVLK
jgi:hypothetical protein